MLANLASLHQEMSEYESALGYYAQSIAIIEELRSAVSSEEARAGFFATVADIYANIVLLCVQMGRAAPAFDYVERARSRAFLDLLAAGSPDMPRTIEAAPMTLAEVQAALPEDALLLEYFTTGLIEAADGAEEGREKLMSLHIGLWGRPPAAVGCFSAADLGVALGRERVIHACLLQERLAMGWAAEIGRLAGFRAIVPGSWPDSWRSVSWGLGGADAGPP